MSEQYKIKYTTSIDKVKMEQILRDELSSVKPEPYKPYESEEVLSKIYFEIEDNVVIKYIPMPEIGENTYKTEVVMTREIFQECYKKWVESQESEVRDEGL